MGDDEAESTLLQIRECFVYKIPPRQTNAGYKAADWHLSQPLWSGRCTVTAKGNMCTIRLENQTGSTQQCVETVTDSSRYFVIRIDDGQGHHAFVGLGFTERSDAFDFNVALSDHEKHLRQMRESKQAAAKLGDAPKVDYSLKEGQTITVKIATKGGMLGTGGHKTDDGGPAVLTALPPPPGSKARPLAATAQQAHHDVGWGDFQAPVQKPAANPQGAFFAQGGGQTAYPPQVLATAIPPPGGVSPQMQRPAASPYPAAVVQQSLFGQPQQQPVGLSPQMMSPQVQPAPSPQMYAPPAGAPQQSLFGQPQQQSAFIMPPQVSTAPQQPASPAPAPATAGMMSFGAPVPQQQWGAFNAAASPAQPKQTNLQQHQFKFN